MNVVWATQSRTLLKNMRGNVLACDGILGNTLLITAHLLRV